MCARRCRDYQQKVTSVSGHGSKPLIHRRRKQGAFLAPSLAEGHRKWRQAKTAHSLAVLREAEEGLIQSFLSRLLKNSLLCAAGMRRSENQTDNRLIFVARRGHVPRRSAVEKARMDFFNELLRDQFATSVSSSPLRCMSIAARNDMPRRITSGCSLSVIPASTFLRTMFPTRTSSSVMETMLA